MPSYPGAYVQWRTEGNLEPLVIFDITIFRGLFLTFFYYYCGGPKMFCYATAYVAYSLSRACLSA